jgi:hypothetical protein
MNKKIFSLIGLVLFFSLMVLACGHKADPYPPGEDEGVKAPKTKRYGTQ